MSSKCPRYKLSKSLLLEGAFGRGIYHSNKSRTRTETSDM